MRIDKEAEWLYLGLQEADEIIEERDLHFSIGIIDADFFNLACYRSSFHVDAAIFYNEVERLKVPEKRYLASAYVRPAVEKLLAELSKLGIKSMGIPLQEALRGKTFGCCDESVLLFCEVKREESFPGAVYCVTYSVYVEE